MLPEGIGVVPLLLNFKAGSEEEVRKSIPDYEQYVRELSEQQVDMTIISGTPPFMLLGYEAEARLIEEWTKRYATPIVTDSQMQAAGLRAMGIKKYIGASYSALQNKIAIIYEAGRADRRGYGTDRGPLRSGSPDSGPTALRPYQEAFPDE